MIYLFTSMTIHNQNTEVPLKSVILSSGLGGTPSATANCAPKLYRKTLITSYKIYIIK